MPGYIFILTLLAVVIVFGYIFYKTSKNNKFLTSMDELKKRGALEGKIVHHQWYYFPPLWQRITATVVTVLLMVGSAAFFYFEEMDRMWYYLLFVATLISFFISHEFHPQSYTLTDKGIWRRFLPLFYHPKAVQKKMKKIRGRERLCYWREVASIRKKKNRVIFLLNPIAENGYNSTFSHYLRWFGGGIRKRAVYLPIGDDDTLEKMEHLIQQSIPEKTSAGKTKDSTTQLMPPKKYTQQTKDYPWELKPLRGLKKFALYCADIFLFLITIFSIPLFIALTALSIAMEQNTLMVINGFVLLLAVYSLRGFSYLNRKLEIQREEGYEDPRKETSSVIHYFNLDLRNFSDYSTIDFKEKGMKVSGKVGPSLLPLLVVLVIFNAILFIIGPEKTLPIIGIQLVALPLVVLVYLLIGRKKASILVEPSNIAKSVFIGPEVILKFKTAPLFRLKRIRFIVPRSFRIKFFQNFHKTFPDVLPATYSDALTKLE